MLHISIQAMKNMLYENRITYSEVSAKTGMSESKLKKIFAGYQSVTLEEHDILLRVILSRVLESSDKT